MPVDDPADHTWRGTWPGAARPAGAPTTTTPASARAAARPSTPTESACGRPGRAAGRLGQVRADHRRLADRRSSRRRRSRRRHGPRSCARDGRASDGESSPTPSASTSVAHLAHAGARPVPRRRRRAHRPTGSRRSPRTAPSSPSPGSAASRSWQIAYSPDGEWLACVAGTFKRSELWLFDPATGDARQATAGAPDVVAVDSIAWLSPARAAGRRLHGDAQGDRPERRLPRLRPGDRERSSRCSTAAACRSAASPSAPRATARPSPSSPTPTSRPTSTAW